jgi:enoyl-CoA hydratase/carnithine racemase
VVADLMALGGAGLALVELDGGGPGPVGGAGVVQLGIRRGGPPPAIDLEAFDLLLFAGLEAPAPWVAVDPSRLDGIIANLQTCVAAQPVAAAVAVQLLRASLRLPLGQALVQESQGYSMLLASEGFRAWRAANPARARAADDDARVAIELSAGELRIRLNRTAARNAFDARMRDELCAALAFAAEHPDVPPVVLSGAGPAFSAGGDLDEFGRADDPGVAHLIRAFRAPAAGVAALGSRLTARLHGACIGAGIEVPAAAARVVAQEGAVFRLPEVAMGLIPGAGGTATIPRRIGRHRAAYMALSGAEIDLTTALAWGLVDARDPVG